jgi:hypothetical protein
MPAAGDWEATIRAVVSHALFQRGCRKGWTVLNHRGHARLNSAAGAGGGKHLQLLLPIPWECDQAALHGAAGQGQGMDHRLLPAPRPPLALSGLLLVPTQTH